MLRLIPLIVLSCFLFSCKTAQVFYTAPSTSDIKEANNLFIYENDTIKLAYSFWEEGGVMAFTIENKLNVPIYIDWKKSSFINTNIKYNYYSEDVRTETKSASASSWFLYSSLYNWDRWYPVNVGASSSQSVSRKDERIMFIPPHSITNRSKFKITYRFVNMRNATKKQLGDSKIKGLVMEATKDNSALFFRNFITYSTKESFEREQYINNEFYVRKVVEVPLRYYEGLANPKRFYIFIDAN